MAHRRDEKSGYVSTSRTKFEFLPAISMRNNPCELPKLTFPAFETLPLPSSRGRIQEEFWKEWFFGILSSHEGTIHEDIVRNLRACLLERTVEKIASEERTELDGCTRFSYYSVRQPPLKTSFFQLYITRCIDRISINLFVSYFLVVILSHTIYIHIHVFLDRWFPCEFLLAFFLFFALIRRRLEEVFAIRSHPVCGRCRVVAIIHGAQC